MFNKEKMMKWAACVGFGIVLSCIVMLIINLIYHGDDIDDVKDAIGNIKIVFFIIHIIWLYFILSKPIQERMKNKTYGIIASIVIVIILALLLTNLSTEWAYKFRTNDSKVPVYGSPLAHTATVSKPDGISVGFPFIILIAAYSIMTYTIAAKIESKK